MTEVTRHFTATVFIVHNDKVLLHYHRKLKKILPVGGHIDRDELPDEAAVREAKEESGLNVTLSSTIKSREFSGVRTLPQPECVLLEDINPHHQHIDFIYFGSSEDDTIQAEGGRDSDFRWYSLEELDSEKIDEDVRELAISAIKRFC